MRRRAKYLLIDLEGGSLILHLGMSGSLRVLPPATPLVTHDHVDILLDSGLALRFNDPRRFGSLLWADGDPLTHPLLRRLAPEPLAASFNGEYLERVTRKRRVAIKQLLMNSQIVVGVGNIYASEALFRARINPRRVAGRLNRAQLARLARAIKTVLNLAIKVGGTTLRDYVGADGNPGTSVKSSMCTSALVSRAAFAAHRSGSSPRASARPTTALTARSELADHSLAYTARIGCSHHRLRGVVPGDHLHVADGRRPVAELVAALLERLALLFP